ncbi:MAG: indolepyruvate ferredoxin oxidoreductase subunit alpha [Defluviitaleaceae bacterium]|nr:indolepyruvate ferredoxin oxidoreductase subunit alpha [Defluviitaleaceae bacterium]
MQDKILMSGDEALARGAYEAGVLFASAYPGTPSTEIMESLAKYDEIHAEWAPNEKIAFEAAAGASIGGVRAMASMKHVGVNLAADPLMTFAYIGVNGGMVLISCDEPGMHSSQNEQDNRTFAHFAKVPLFEPSNSQECLDMVKEAFDHSEKYDTPVIIRVTTRVCHSKSLVQTGERIEPPIKEYVKNIQKTLPVPVFSRGRRKLIEERFKELAEYSEKTHLNYIEPSNTKVGVIASGMCINFAKEVFGEAASYLKLGYTNPLPENLLKEFYSQVDKVYVIEENDPIMQNWIERLGYEVIGKPTFLPYGEMTPDVIRHAVYGDKLPVQEINEEILVHRPPNLCSGCPHRGFFFELSKKARKHDTVIAGDIGCYTLGFGEPYATMDYVVCMGSAFSAAHGTQKAFEAAGRENTKVVGVMGDSTFFHTGMNSLIEVLYNGNDVICVILDNRTTGMTGQQENPGSGRNIKMQDTPDIDIETVVKSLGAKNVARINPNNLKEVRETLDKAYATNEPYVIITDWPCALKPMGEKDYEKYGKDLFKKRYTVVEEKCIGCEACIKVGCPAIAMIKEGKELVNKKGQVATIDETCVGCDICAQVCPTQAIQFSAELSKLLDGASKQKKPDFFN